MEVTLSNGATITVTQKTLEIANLAFGAKHELIRATLWKPNWFYQEAEKLCRNSEDELKFELAQYNLTDEHSSELKKALYETTYCIS